MDLRTKHPQLPVQKAAMFYFHFSKGQMFLMLPHALLHDVHRIKSDFSRPPHLHPYMDSQKGQDHF